MQFLDRNRELGRLDGLLKGSGLGVVWGRRRVGKTRLLVEWCRRHDGVYFVADQSSVSLQRRYFADALSVRFPGFSDVEYPDWSTLFRRLSVEAQRSAWRGPVVVDELPYLVEMASELPSILQRWIDHEAKAAKLTLVLAGSSQRMMQGLVLDADAPLYGRAREHFALDPLPANWIRKAFEDSSPTLAVERYAVWGGTPHYWELALDCGSRALSTQLDRVVLDPAGPLHLEPSRLLMEEQPPATALRPLLDAIGMGCHRSSEIAARIGQPATSLHRPLQRLMELGLVVREVPFGESEKNLKRSLYRMDDPFFRMWFRLVAPHRSALAQATEQGRLALWHTHRQALLSETWESLCRASLPRMVQGSLGKLAPWSPAQRYWHGNGPEWDVVAATLDGKHLFLGEVKWHDRPATKGAVEAAKNALLAKGVPPGVPADATIHRAVFVPKKPPGGSTKGFHCLDAEDVLHALA